jgi:hypothetical protein
MRLCHPPDGSARPKYKLLCFKPPYVFKEIQNALAFNRDMCCHLALCLRLLPFHCHNCIIDAIVLLSLKLAEKAVNISKVCRKAVKFVKKL